LIEIVPSIIGVNFVIVGAHSEHGAQSS